jgi:hypothetical protein
MRALVGVFLAVILGAALPAAAAPPFTDPAGDTAGPDVAAVTVSNDAKELELDVAFANRTALVAGDAVLVDLDLDGNRKTGEEGVDLYAALEGEEEPAVFVWKDGDFAESADAKAAYGPSTATLTVPLDLVVGVVGISVLAVGGPDPDVSPTDHAPDAGSWTYTAEAPALPKRTVRFRPSTPRAGRLFAVAAVTLSSDLVGAVAPKQLLCRASLGRAALKQASPCAWRLPKRARGKTLSVSVVARYAGSAYALPTARLKVR